MPKAEKVMKPTKMWAVVCDDNIIRGVYGTREIARSHLKFTPFRVIRVLVTEVPK